MKLIYNIINYAKGGGFLEIKLQLSKKDWILVNQVADKPLLITVEVDDLDVVSEISTGIEKHGGGFGRPFLSINFMAENFNEIEIEGAGPYWESSSYKIKLSIVSPSFRKIIDSVAEELQNQLNTKKRMIPATDTSCWGEEVTVNY